MTSTEIMVLAAEEASGIALLLPDPAELVGGIIAFAIVFFFIRLWAWPAISRALEAQQQAITGRLQDAEQAKSEAESLLEDYRVQMAEAQARRNEMLEEARTAAEEMRTELLARAQAEAEEIVAKARTEAAAERGRVMADARQEVTSLSLDLAEKVVAGSLDREAQQSLVERYLAELERA